MVRDAGEYITTVGECVVVDDDQTSFKVTKVTFPTLKAKVV
jgi:hypothetical protein